MEKQSIEQFLFTNSVNLDLDPILLLMNMAVAMLISLAISFHFLKLGSVFSNKTQLARLFPFITLTTVLVISVVKSSLALSLGLVGALSIVRFRTPIKEPEELVYLFLRNTQGMPFGIRVNIEEGEETVVFGNFIAGNLAIDDPCKNASHCGGNWD